MFCLLATARQKDVHANTADVKFSTKQCETGNVDVQDSLTNDAMGILTVTILNKTFASTRDYTEAILVSFHRPQPSSNVLCATKYKHINYSAVPIKCCKHGKSQSEDVLHKIPPPFCVGQLPSINA